MVEDSSWLNRGQIAAFVGDDPRTIQGIEEIQRQVVEDLPTIIAEVQAAKADKTVQVIAGAGLSGGGNLAADRTLTLDQAFAAELARDTLGTALTAGTGITKTTDDPGDTITLAIDTAAEAERIRDVIGAALVGSASLSVTPDDPGDTITLASLPSAVTTQAGAAYTAVLADANGYIRFTNGAAVSFTIPPNSSVAFAVGTVIEVEQAGAGALSLVAGAGVTINSRGADLTLAGQYAVAAVKKVATDTWTLTGDL